jgi:hypothetical protein
MVGPRRRVVGSLLAAVVSALLILAVEAAPAVACTSEDTPTPLATLVREAGAVVVTHDLQQAADGSVSLRPDRVYGTQDAPDAYQIAWPTDSDCPYPWGLPTGDQQALVLIADGATGPTISDYWVADAGGRLLTPIHHAEVHRPIRTLAGLLDFVLAGAPPDTSTADPVPLVAHAGSPLGPISVAIGLLAGLWVATHPRRRASPRTP